MKILAIDPGTYKSAWVIFNSGNKEVRAGIEKNETLLAMVEAAPWFASDYPEAVVIEMIKSYGNVMGDELIQTCVWIGRFIQARTKGAIGTDLLPRKQVVMQLCNNPRANDSTVRQALIDRWGGKTIAVGNSKAPGPLYGVKNDMWAALGVAVAWFEIKQQNKIQLERALQ